MISQNDLLNISTARNHVHISIFVPTCFHRERFMIVRSAFPIYQ